MKKFLLHWFPAIAWMIIIFAFSAQPKGGLPDYGEEDFLFKKIAHILEYGLLAALMLRGVKSDAKIRISHLFTSFALTALYAVSDEVHQLFVPGREGRILDVVFDSLGATISLSLLWLWFRLRAVPSPNKSE
jgi:VanZ family protein